MQRIIFVHGISNSVITWDYPAEFRGLLVQKLKDLGAISQNSTDEDIAKYITFENVNYSNIGQSEEDGVLNAYNQDSNKLYNIFDKIIENIALKSVRRELITSVADVLLYQSDYWRDQIRNTLKSKIQPYINTGDEVTIVAHSLGTVVSFDTLYNSYTLDDDWKKSNFRVKNLFTLGSPIALFSVDLKNANGEQKERYMSMQMMIENNITNPNIQIVADNGVWYNFFDAQDLIGYPLESLFKDKFKLKDILVQTGTFPMNAHVNYWKNKNIVKTIAERLVVN